MTGTRRQTAGEQLVGRTLTMENRSGIPHYVPGQHHAQITEAEGERVASVSYVDQMGHAVYVLCDDVRGGTYRPGMVGRAGVNFFEGWGVVGDDIEFELSEKMLAALKDAESRVEHVESLNRERPELSLVEETPDEGDES